MVTADFVDFFLEATEAGLWPHPHGGGKGDGKAADGAVEAMRAVFDKVPFDGRSCYRRRERDDAPMLWIGSH